MNYKTIIFTLISISFLFSPELFAATVSDMNEALNKNNNEKIITIIAQIIGLSVSIYIYFLGVIGLKKYADDQSKPIAKPIIMIIVGFLLMAGVTFTTTTDTYCYHSHYDDPAFSSENYMDRGF
jgi:uncharacterized membrane protein